MMIPRNIKWFFLVFRRNIKWFFLVFLHYAIIIILIVHVWNIFQPRSADNVEIVTGRISDVYGEKVGVRSPWRIFFKVDGRLCYFTLNWKETQTREWVESTVEELRQEANEGQTVQVWLTDAKGWWERLYVWDCDRAVAITTEKLVIPVDYYNEYKGIARVLSFILISVHTVVSIIYLFFIDAPLRFSGYMIKKKRKTSKKAKKGDESPLDEGKKETKSKRRKTTVSGLQNGVVPQILRTNKKSNEKDEINTGSKLFTVTLPKAFFVIGCAGAVVTAVLFVCFLLFLDKGRIGVLAAVMLFFLLSSALMAAAVSFRIDIYASKDYFDYRTSFGRTYRVYYCDCTYKPTQEALYLYAQKRFFVDPMSVNFDLFLRQIQKRCKKKSSRNQP